MDGDSPKYIKTFLYIYIHILHCITAYLYMCVCMYIYIYVYVYDTVGLDAIPISLFKKNSQTSYNVTREYVVVSCFCNGDWKKQKTHSTVHLVYRWLFVCLKTLQDATLYVDISFQCIYHILPTCVYTELTLLSKVCLKPFLIEPIASKEAASNILCN